MVPVFQGRPTPPLPTHIPATHAAPRVNLQKSPFAAAPLESYDMAYLPQPIAPKNNSTTPEIFLHKDDIFTNINRPFMTCGHQQYSENTASLSDAAVPEGIPFGGGGGPLPLPPPPRVRITTTYNKTTSSSKGKQRDREEILARWREKKAKLNFNRHRGVQYESRKRTAMIKPRINGKFVTPDVYEKYLEQAKLHQVPAAK